MAYEHILTKLEEGIFTITFNRPDSLNAFNWRQQWEFNCALHDANDDKNARVVVITGAGRAFSAGLDLKEGMKDWGKPLSNRKLVEIPDLIIKHFTKPVIAAVNGPAVGWGCTLSLLCDMRYAAKSAYFSMRFVRVGLIPEAGSPYLLPRIVGLAKAMELGLTARDISAEEAASIGMVNAVYPDEELIPKVYETAKVIADMPRMSIEFARRNFLDALEQTWDEQQKQEKSTFAKCALSEEHREARMRFAQRKKE